MAIKIFYAPPEIQEDFKKRPATDWGKSCTIPGQAEGLSTIVDRYLRDGITPLGNNYTSYDSAGEDVVNDTAPNTTFGIDIDDYQELKDDLNAKADALKQAQARYAKAVEEAQRMRQAEAAKRSGEVQNAGNK